jgi:ATP-binding protein involved in chromosome partitioning
MEISEKQRKQFEIETQKISDNMAKIKHRIVVFSGKGGVGKTTVSVNLAYGLCRINKQTGLLDADVTGPNVAKMLGLVKWGETTGDRIIPENHLGVKVISFASFIPSDQPIIWRGPMRSKLLNQFLGDVEWGDLDYLVADLPPGTGDEILTMTQQMKPDLAIIVTTPQELSLIDSKKAVNMAKKMEVPTIGIIENMSGFVCPECGHPIDLYGKGGGEKQAKEMDLLFFGALPLNTDTISLADNGKPIILEKRDADISIAMTKIIDRIQNLFID